MLTYRYVSFEGLVVRRYTISVPSLQSTLLLSTDNAPGTGASVITPEVALLLQLVQHGVGPAQRSPDD